VNASTNRSATATSAGQKSWLAGHRESRATSLPMTTVGPSAVASTSTVVPGPRSTARYVDGCGCRTASSDSKISRIEAGKHAVLPADVLAMLDIYGVTDEFDRGTLARLAEQSDLPGWWVSYGNAMPQSFEVYVGLESEATEVRAMETHLVPGLLQTEGYATALIRAGQQLAPAEEVARQVALRLARQRRLTVDPLRLRAVIGEAVLRCRVGDAVTMQDQLTQLARLAGRSNVELRVLEFASPAYTAFALVSMP